MTYNDWLILAADYWVRNNSSQRLGQAYFNSLYEHRPDIANRIRATHVDPFHNDLLLREFFVRTQELW